MFFVTAFSVLVPLVVFMAFLWVWHIAWKDHEIISLKQDVKDRDVTIGLLNDRLSRLDSERVPLRSKCWCKHDAVLHDSNGCRVEFPFRWACACQISRDEVWYTPDPMRKTMPLYVMDAF